jgi:aspartate/tyrosine/aromatic aminotransferase
MLEKLSPQASDPLLGVLTAFRADPSADKIDLGVGVYRDERGTTPVMAALRLAEQRIVGEATTKAYVGPAGNREFAAAIEVLTLGADHAALRAGRVATLQTPGGCGALHLGAKLAQACGASEIRLSVPTWANHTPLLSGAGLRLGTYPYLDIRTGLPDVDALLGALADAEAGTLVLLQASCHNPTGADLPRAAWEAIAEVLARRGLVPFVDVAYQGLGDGLEQDVAGVRLLAERLPELLVAVSCSKNFGLYRERAGAIIAIGPTPTAAANAMGHLQAIARRIYSMPPDHGAAIVAAVWRDAALRGSWQRELDSMRERVLALRRALTKALRERGMTRFDCIEQQRGMFSLLGLPPSVVDTLRIEHHVYLAPDSRINVAGLRLGQVERVAAAIHSSLGEGA